MYIYVQVWGRGVSVCVSVCLSVCVCSSTARAHCHMCVQSDASSMRVCKYKYRYIYICIFLVQFFQKSCPKGIRPCRYSLSEGKTTRNSFFFCLNVRNIPSTTTSYRNTCSNQPHGSLFQFVTFSFATSCRRRLCCCHCQWRTSYPRKGPYGCHTIIVHQRNEIILIIIIILINRSTGSHGSHFIVPS